MPLYYQITPNVVKSLRIRRGWTQERLASETKGKHGGVDIRTIKRIERSAESYRCKAIIALSLSEAFAVSIEELCHPIYPMTYDAGGGILLEFSWDADPDALRAGTEKLIEMIERRNRLVAPKD